MPVSISYETVQFTPADMQSSIAPAETLRPPVPNESRPTFSSQVPAPPVPTGNKPKGMQLNAHKATSPGVLPGGLAEEVRWGDDLMDVHADADDWSTYHILNSTVSALTNQSHSQMNSKARQYIRVAPTPSARVGGEAQRMMRTRGVHSRTPLHHPCPYRLRNSRRLRCRLRRHRPGRPQRALRDLRASRRSRRLQVRAHHHWRPPRRVRV